MTKVTPFSNGTDAMTWYHNNCDTCKPKCPKKRNIDLSFVTGEITLATAEYIGYENEPYFVLKDCQHKNKYRPKRKANDLPTLF